MQSPIPQACLTALRAHANAADADPVWPETSWIALKDAGVFGWEIDPVLGGNGLDGVPLLEAMESLAGACMTTCFILSQRQAAVRRISDLARDSLRSELLQPLAEGSQFSTVGLSQLTTSRQHGQTPLIAREVANGFVFDGVIPWVTGAARADHFIVGATLDTGLQVLCVVPANSPGLSVRPPFDLMALQGSLTAEVVLDGVHVERRWLLAGPVEKVLSSRRGGAGGLETSCLAIGLSGAAIEYLTAEAVHRPEIAPMAASLDDERRAVRQAMHHIALHGGEAYATANLRTNANALVLRATQAALMMAKGAGFLRDHPAQRWARQALFFLVWSCPRPTVLATLAKLADSGER